MEEEMEQDSIEAAEALIEYQGNHEAEVSCGGEADLHQHYIRCKKNPGHSQFIPIQNLNIEHLPSGYRDAVILDMIRAEANMTCRLSVRYTSKNRPKFYPGRQLLSFYPFYQNRGGNSLTRTGTGSVYLVEKYTEKDNRNCECADCSRAGTHTPNKVWGKVIIRTACHVIFDSDEAKHTKCEFFYDTSTTDISRCPTLAGLTVEKSNIEQDWCDIACVTHDMDIINELYKMHGHCSDLWKKVYNKYQPNKNNGLLVPGVSCVTDPTPAPTVIISHPHGCSKMVTVGMWIHRQTWTETFKHKSDKGWGADVVVTSYTYDTPTCRGSSGAPVFRLSMKGKQWCGWECHAHSEGSQGNYNKSGIMGEFVSPTTILLNMHTD